MQDFIQSFVELFDEVPDIEILPDTEFKDIPDWDSLVALSLIVMVSNNYGKSIDGDVIRNATTIGDLYGVING
jgi:acyl carrier protein